MGHRWFNVDIEVNDNGDAEVLFEGNVEFPMGEEVRLEPGDKLHVHGKVDIGDDLADQPKSVSWSMRDGVEGIVLAKGGDE